MSSKARRKRRAEANANAAQTKKERDDKAKEKKKSDDIDKLVRERQEAEAEEARAREEEEEEGIEDSGQEEEEEEGEAEALEEEENLGAPEEQDPTQIQNPANIYHFSLLHFAEAFKAKIDLLAHNDMVFRIYHKFLEISNDRAGYFRLQSSAYEAGLKMFTPQEARRPRYRRGAGTLSIGNT